MRILLGAIVIVTRAIVVVTRLGCISLWSPHGRQVLTTRGLACWLASWHTAADPGIRNWDVALSQDEALPRESPTWTAESLQTIRGSAAQVRT